MNKGTAKEEKLNFQLLSDLKERDKQLWSHHEISRLFDNPELPPDEIFQKIVELLPKGMHFPYKTVACVIIDDRTFTGDGFVDSKTAVRVTIVADGQSRGLIKVCQTDSKKTNDVLDFAEGERDLVVQVARRLGYYLERLNRNRHYVDVERRYQNLIEKINDVIFEFDDQGLITYMSSSVNEVLGYTPEEMIGRPLFDFMASGQVEAQDRLQELISQGGMAENEYEILRKDGTRCWMRTSTTMLLRDGRHSAGHCRLIDISEIKRMELELQKREVLHRSVMAASPDVIVVTDLEGRIIYVSDRVMEMLRYDNVDDFAGRSLVDYLDPAHAAMAAERIARMFQGIQGVAEKYVARRRDGSTLDIEVKGEFVRDAAGQPINMIFVIRDISLREQLEDQLRNSEEKYRRLIESSDAAIMLVDPDGHFLYLNGIAAEPFGLSPEEMTGKTMQDLLSQEEAEDTMTNIRRVIRTNEGMVLEPQTNIAGVKRWTRTSVQPIRDASGAAVAVMMHATDITPIKQAELLIKQSEEKYRALFSDSPDGYLILQGGVFIECNVAAEKMMRGDRGQILGKSPAQLSPDCQPNGHISAELAAELFMGGRDAGRNTFEWVHQRFDGSRFLAQIDLVPIQYEGQPALFTTWRDISEHRQIEKGLNRKEKMLQAIAQSTEELLSNPDLLDAISRSLPLIGEAVEADRAYLFQNGLDEKNQQVISQRCEWNAGTVAPQISNPELQNLTITIFDDVLDDLLQRKPFEAVVAQLPAESALKKTLEKQEISSILIIPIFLKDQFWGFVGYDECKYERKWAADEISILRSYCNSISSALERAQAVEELNNMALFPQENPNPLFRIDLNGGVMLRNPAASGISHFSHLGMDYSFGRFAEKIASEIDRDHPARTFEIEHEGDIYLLDARLSQNQIHINCHGTNITDLKNTQRELERLSMVASVNRLGVLFTGARGRINYANEAFLQMTGFELADVKERSLIDLCRSPLVWSEQIESLVDGYDKTRPVDLEIVMYRKDRSWFWANLKMQPLEAKNGEASEFFATIEDVSEKKNADEVLRNSENRLSTLIRNLKEGILLEDEHRRIVLTNEQFCRIFQIAASPEALIGADCSQSAEHSKHLAMHPEEFVQRIDQIIREKKMALSEELEMANGEVYERDYIPIIINDDIKGHLWKYQDITERKNHERTLRRQEEKYRNIIVNMNLGLVETDQQGIVQYANQRIVEMSGFAVDELVGRNPVELFIAPEYRQTAEEHIRLRSSGISDLYEVQARTRDGEIRWWVISGAPIFSEEGQFIGSVGIYLDVTEQKQLERELEIARDKAEDSSRSKEAFLANMSHEIRTPLNAIIGMVREFSREKLPPRQAVYMKNAGTASRHLLSIVNDVLDISKIEAGQLQLDSRPFSLRDVINDAIAIEKPSANDKMLDLRAIVSDEVAPAYLGDPGRIRQILVNLLSNSVKFTQQGSITAECKVTARHDSSHDLMITVTDTGIGMDESYLSRIFDKFSQEDAAVSRRVGGTGLGMRITYELVQRMNGHITVNSKKGIGTTVTITLNLEFLDQFDLGRADSPRVYDRLNNVAALLVEDSDMNRLVATSALEHFGIKVTEAVNGAEAIEKLKQQSFNIILMDLQMPVLDGLGATRIIRQELLLQTPIIALTANAFKSEIERCLQAGMNDYITKPFEEEVFLSVILKNLGDASPAPSPGGEGPQNAPEGKRYDLSPLEKISGGDKETIRQVVRLFIKQTPEAVDQIKKAYANSELDAVAKTAHRIKPTIDLLGISRSAQDVRAVESLAKEGAVGADLEAAIGRLETELHSVVAELAADPILN